MDELMTRGCEVAMRAAAEYLRVHHLTAAEDALLTCLRERVKARLTEALTDAKEALACGMDKVAEQTFAASMALAGIDAAKEAAAPATRPNTYQGADR